MSIPRYARPDLYTTTELLREFAALDPGGRVRLLRRILRDGQSWLPDEVQRAAAADPSPLVRQTLAQEARSLADDVEVQLKGDDEFLRACRREAESYASLREGEIVRMSQIERLAFLRSRAALEDESSVQRVFTFDDDFLSENERLRCIFAYLANPYLDRHYEHMALVDDDELFDMGFSAIRDTEALWDLAAAWTGKWTAIADLVFQHLPTTDEKRAAVYAVSTDERRKLSILLGCRRADHKTLALGAAEQDKDCRGVATKLGVAPPDEEDRKQWNEWKEKVTSARKVLSRSRTVGWLLDKANYVGMTITFMVYWNWFVGPAIHGTQIGIAAAVGITTAGRLLWSGANHSKLLLAAHVEVMRGLRFTYLTLRWLASRRKRRVGLWTSGPTGIYGSQDSPPAFWRQADTNQFLSGEFNDFVREDPAELPTEPFGTAAEVFWTETVPIAFTFGMAFVLRAAAPIFG